MNRYTATCKKDELRHIREFVTNVLKKHSVSDVRINEMVLAVDEVSANLIIHSCACNPNYSIELNIAKVGEEILFEFVNRGERFNILEYQEPSIEEIVETKRKGGLGLMLVNRIMDRIEYDKSDEKETYRLFKKL